MINSIYIKIPKKQINTIKSKQDFTVISPFKVKTDAKGNCIAEFRFEEDLSDIRIRFLLYSAIVLYYGFTKQTLKEFNTISDIDFYAIDEVELIHNEDAILNIVDTVEEATVLKKREVILNFCKRTGLARINSQPAVMNVNDNVSGAVYGEIMSRDNTWHNKTSDTKEC